MTSAASTPAVQWRDEPEAHDFPAAASYLSLLADHAQVRLIVEALEHAKPQSAKAKDILRASGLPLLTTDNPHVASDLAKVAASKPLSPILCVRGSLKPVRPLQIADGYHRVCASYHVDENTDIPVLLVDLP